MGKVHTLGAKRMSRQITGAAAETLAEVLKRNQGPTKLYNCFIDYCVLPNGLRGNSRLKSLRPPIVRNYGDGNQKLLQSMAPSKKTKVSLN
jgi:hypothetical protein